MKERKIIVSVDKDGETKIEAEGFDDASCLKETESLESVLGVVKTRYNKAEAYKNKAGVKINNNSK